MAADGCMLDLNKPYLEVWSEGVRQTHIPRKGAEDEVPHLDAAGRDDVAEAEVVIAQELGKVVQQDQKDAESALVEQANLGDGNPSVRH